MKRKMIVLLSTVCTFVFLTGCYQKPFYFDFSRFVKKETVSKESIYGLSLDTIIQKNDIYNIQKKIEKLYDELSSYTISENYLDKMQPYLTNKYYKELQSGKKKNIIETSIKEMKAEENMELKEINVISAKETTKGRTYEFQIISINQELLFQVEIISIDFNVQEKIEDVNIISNTTSKTNTIKALGEDSFLQQDHQDFLKEVNRFFSDLKNEALYNSLKEGKTKKNTVILRALLKKMPFDNKEEKALFLAGKGVFEEYAILSYCIDDYDSGAVTTYEIAFGTSKKYQSFYITYNRVLKQIMDIKKI